MVNITLDVSITRTPARKSLLTVAETTTPRVYVTRTNDVGAQWDYLSSYVRAAQAEEDARVFAQLVDEWRRDTRALSSSQAIAIHPAYQRIIGMGKRALPLILRELRRRPDHWFWALTVIARTTPVPPDEAGNMRAMRERWLDWGRDEGYLD